MNEKGEAVVDENFNSIKVRLERCTGIPATAYPYHFNSIKVRLERPCSFLCWGSSYLFQFHKGTIRTKNCLSLQQIYKCISIP